MEKRHFLLCSDEGRGFSPVWLLPEVLCKPSEHQLQRGLVLRLLSIHTFEADLEPPCTSACTYGCSHLQQTFTETFLPLTCSKTLQKTRRTEANSCLKERLLLKEDHRTEEELSWGGGGSCPQAGAFSASQNCRLMQFAKQRSYETGYFDTTC